MDKNKYDENVENIEISGYKKENNTKDSDAICSPKQLLVILFIVSLCFIILFYRNIYNNPLKNKIINKIINKSYHFDTSNLHFIEDALNSLPPNDSYKGPVFPDDGKITKEWVLNLIEFMKDLENKKSLEEKYLDKINLLKLLLKGKKVLNEYQEALVDVDTFEGNNITVVGDTHGQFYDLLHIFEINGFPGEDNIYVFNGDFVDRGAFGVECMCTLISLKILYPNYVFLNRGNHEDKSINFFYGFQHEVHEKYNDEDIYESFHELFKFLPLGHVLNEDVLVIHGGLFSKDGVTLDELKQINRFIDVPSEGLMNEILWSDPFDGNGTQPSSRGAGVYYGQDVTEKFLKENNLKLLIRSHEVRDEGYSIEHGGKHITVFSAPNYCDQAGNKGAIVKFDRGDMEHPYFIKFNASPHPIIPID
jgi:serine/threonine-protein phosphatase 5